MLFACRPSNSYMTQDVRVPRWVLRIIVHSASCAGKQQYDRPSGWSDPAIVARASVLNLYSYYYTARKVANTLQVPVETNSGTISSNHLHTQQPASFSALQLLYDV